ncbi:MAG TPA: hypothetical protein PKW79_03460 [Rhabdochlamydiaceae bacterium]|nr:hypothetical protein [Rhabdochlamydiaceae bacterium]
MNIKVILVFVCCGLLAGCYESGPEEDDVRTVPVTNNPNAMPGPMKMSPLPSIF